MKGRRSGGRAGPGGSRASKSPTRAKLRQWWLIAFVLGVVMINYPFLQIFNRPRLLGGFSLLFVYLTLGWAASIGIIALYAWVLGRVPPDEEG